MTIFEKIVKKEIPAYIIYEDDLVMAFLDISQATIGHTLVIPKDTYKDIYEIPSSLFKHLMAVTQKITIAIKKAFSPEGINLINNNEHAAGQSVFHYHFHIVPRYKDDNFQINFVNNINNLDENEYKKRANLIKEALL